LRRIKILKAGEIKVDSYQPHSFVQNQVFLSNREILDRFREMSSKKSIKRVSKKSGLVYDDDKILFATEVINIILNEIDDEK